jgi:dihydroneopterin aldolase
MPLHDRQEVGRFPAPNGIDRHERLGSRSGGCAPDAELGYPFAVADVILLEGIQVPAALGVTVAERRHRRPVLLDLEVTSDLRRAGRSDRIRQTIHYKRIFEVVEDVASNYEHKLVEALGDRIARAVLSKFDADAVTVTVRKPQPISGVLDYAGVRITRTREDVS